MRSLLSTGKVPTAAASLMWYSRAYLQAHTLFAGPWRMEAVRDALPVFLQAYTRPDYTANTAIIFGTQLENTPLAKEQSRDRRQPSSANISGRGWSSPPSIRCHAADRARMERRDPGLPRRLRSLLGGRLRLRRDPYRNSSREPAPYRNCRSLGSAASSLDPRVRARPRRCCDDAWRNKLIYDEHTWTYVGATTQPEHHQSEDQIALKGARVTRARNDIDESIQRGWAQLEALVQTKGQLRRRLQLAELDSQSASLKPIFPKGSTLDRQLRRAKKSRSRCFARAREFLCPASVLAISACDSG